MFSASYRRTCRTGRGCRYSEGRRNARDLRNPLRRPCRRRHRFLLLLNDVLDAMREEPNFHQAMLHRDPDAAHRFMLYETWEDHADVLETRSSTIPASLSRRAAQPACRAARYFGLAADARRSPPVQSVAGWLVAYDETTAARVRRALSGRLHLVEKKMMGGVCFMVRGNVLRRHRLGPYGPGWTRSIPADAHSAHVCPMEFAGRRPTGFVLVDPEGYRTDAALATWIERGIDFVSTLPVKERTAKSPRRKPRERQ